TEVTRLARKRYVPHPRVPLRRRPAAQATRARASPIMEPMGLLDRWRRRKAPLLTITGDVGQGSVVVLVHGIASSSVTFDNLVPLLSDTHRVISLDLLGFGQTPAPNTASFTIEEHVDSLARTIDILQLDEPFVLVGHSMGSLIATRY